MKKLILAILTACALMTSASVHAQTTVVVQRPGLLSGLVDTAEALLLLPLAVAEGVVVGTAEAADAILCGSTTVYRTPAPIYTAPAPVVVAPAPVVVAPAPVQTTTVTRTRTTTVSTTTTTTTTRPSYEVVVPRRTIVRYRYR
ncbi:MAG: hypothetical protein J6Y92_04110 [Lentisphaeria bacterium]|nr:hypothetical protein [Lentisphaeria bacterium]